MPATKVLVTGGAGYIGSHTVLALRDAGYEAVVIDDLSTGKAERVPDGVRLLEGSVGDEKFVADVLQAEKCGSVVHFAGSSIVEESVTDPLKYYANNVANSQALIAACVRSDVNAFLFSSTAAVYGEPDETPIVESAEPKPINPYGRSKLMIEGMLQDVAAITPGFHYGILRYFNVAGADPRGRSGQSSENATHLIKIACEALVGKRDGVEVYGTDYDTEDGTCVRDYIHVSDLADVHLALLRKMLAEPKNHLLNCGYGRGYSVRQVLAAAARMSNDGLNLRDGNRRAGDPAILVADVGRLHQVLDWRPKHDDLDRIIETALAWEHRLRDDGDG